MTTEEKIKQVESIHRSILSQEISCNIQREIEWYKQEMSPERDRLIAELEAEGVHIKLNYASSLFNGGPAIEVVEA